MSIVVKAEHINLIVYKYLQEMGKTKKHETHLKSINPTLIYP